MALEAFALTDKVAIVTGASRGIGRAISLAMAEAGADLVLVSRSEADLEQVAAAARERGRRVVVVPADVARSSDVAALFETTVAEFGRVDILVNNAGICPFLLKAEDLREDGWDRIMNVNLKGTFLCAQAAGRIMIRQQRGAIVNMASFAGFHGEPGLLAYSVSKAGVACMTKLLATEWAQHNIRVNAVAPGIIAAGMNEPFLRQEHMREFFGRLPLRRGGTAEEVAAAVVFLASDAASYITGDTLLVDGGALGFSPMTLGTAAGKLSL